MTSSDLVAVAVADIVVRDRVRKTIGSVLGLCESIGRVGLLHPIVLNTRHELIAGLRRLEAVKKLGWATIPARVVGTLDDAVAALQAERDENNCRENFTPSEIVEIGRRLEAIEKPKAKGRKKEGGKAGGKASGKLPEASTSDTRDKVGAALGVSGKTYEKAKQVVEAAEAEPEKFGDLPAKMDAESISAAHAELMLRQEPEPAPQPEATPEPEPVDAGAEFVAAVEAICRETDQIAARIKALKSSPFAYSIHFDSAVSQYEAARKTLWQGRPAHECPYCKGEEAACKACKGTGRVKKSTYDSGRAAAGAA